VGARGSSSLPSDPQRDTRSVDARSLTDGLVTHWTLSRRTREALAVVAVAGAVAGCRYPLGLVVTIVCGCVLVRSAATGEIVAEALVPYVTALGEAFGAGCAEVLCTDAPPRRRREAPVAWALRAWRSGIEARVEHHECSFGHHGLGCDHRPFRVDDDLAADWPHPFADWMEELRTDCLVR
jgi:hypothetical protein